MLTGKQKRHLRALGHHLDPVVHIGKQGVTDAVTKAVDAALEKHELIKVRIGTECPESPKEVSSALAPTVGADVAQSVGRTALLYRKHPKQPKIALPPGNAVGAES